MDRPVSRNALKIDDAAVTAKVAEVWCMAEFPDRALDWSGWRELFDIAGYTVDGEVAARPTETLRLYRAASRENREGHSWSSSREVAQLFLTAGGRGQHNGLLWQADVEPWRLLAQTWRDRANDHEPQYVVETDGLIIWEA